MELWETLISGAFITKPINSLHCCEQRPQGEAASRSKLIYCSSYLLSFSGKSIYFSAHWVLTFPPQIFSHLSLGRRLLTWDARGLLESDGNLMLNGCFSGSQLGTHRVLCILRQRTALCMPYSLVTLRVPQSLWLLRGWPGGRVLTQSMAQETRQSSQHRGGWFMCHLD